MNSIVSELIYAAIIIISVFLVSRYSTNNILFELEQIVKKLEDLEKRRQLHLMR